MLGFISFIEKEGMYIGGYLGTDEELNPVEFAVTEAIKPPDRLQQILYGAQLDMKWFGDLIAGTLFEGAKKSESSEERQIRAFFVSDKRMLHLRRKTDNIPVAFIATDEQIFTHEKYPEDKGIVAPILEKIRTYTSVIEVLSRVDKGLEEQISSASEAGK